MSMDGRITGVDLSKVTRVELIDETGRAYVSHKIVDVELQLQDDSRTLKVFLVTKQ